MSDTKEKIVELGEHLIRMVGYNAFSYYDISSSLGIKNAAIHYHYPTKEKLGENIIRESYQRFRLFEADLERRQLNELEKLKAFFSIYTESMKQAKVCLVGSLGPDFHTLGTIMQEELKRMAEEIHYWVSDVLENGRKKKIFRFSGDSSVKAIMIITNMLATLQLARISTKFDLKHVQEQVINDLLS
jgi:AcrR family transcriptional regulator